MSQTPVERAEELLRSGEGIVFDPGNSLEGEACASAAHIINVFRTTRTTLLNKRDPLVRIFNHNGLDFATFRPAHIVDVFRRKLLADPTEPANVTPPRENYSSYGLLKCSLVFERVPVSPPGTGEIGKTPINQVCKYSGDIYYAPWVAIKNYLKVNDIDFFNQDLSDFRHTHVGFIQGNSEVYTYLSQYYEISHIVGPPVFPVVLRGRYAQAAFNQDYISSSYSRSGFLYMLSRYYMQKKHSSNASPPKYSPILTIQQASGAGKSRMTSELAPFVFPIIISGPNLHGVPEECPVLSSFKQDVLNTLKQQGATTNIKCVMTVIATFFHRCIYYSIENALNLPNNECFTKGCTVPSEKGELIKYRLVEYLCSNQIEGTIIEDAPLNSTIALIPNSDPLCTQENLQLKLVELKRRRIEYLATLPNPNNLERDVGYLPDVIIVLDEADSHLANSISELVWVTFGGKVLSADFYGLISRTLRFWKFAWEKSWFLSLSTNATMSNFSQKNRPHSSLRPFEEIEVMPGFIYNSGFDVFAAGYYRLREWLDPIVSNESSGISPSQRLKSEFNAANYVRYWDRVLDIITCGRPLWYSTYVQQRADTLSGLRELKGLSLASAPQDLINDFLAASKYIRIKIYGQNDIDPLHSEANSVVDRSVGFAVFAAAVGLYDVHGAVDKTELTRIRLAWAVSYDTGLDQHSVSYPSEGSFNSLMGHLLSEKLSQYFKSENILSFAKPSTKTIYSSWQVAEFLGRTAFIKAIFKTPSVNHTSDADQRKLFPSHVFGPRLMGNFLRNFVTGTDALAQLAILEARLPEIYRDGLVAFSYFSRALEVKEPIHFAMSCLYRGHGRICPPGHEGADFIIPMATADGRVGLILVQVKNRATNFIRRDSNNDEAVKALVENTKTFNLFTVFGLKSVSESQKSPLLDADDDDDDPKGPQNQPKKAKVTKGKPTTTKKTSSAKLVKLKELAGMELANPYNLRKRTTASSSNPQASSSNPGQIEELSGMGDDHQFADFPCVRIFLNMHSKVEPGCAIYKDEHGPLIVIQNQGTFEFLSKEENVLFKNALAKSPELLQGRLPEVEGSMRAAPASRTGITADTPTPIIPFNAFLKNGIHVDNDAVALGNNPIAIDRFQLTDEDVNTDFLVNL